MRLLAKTISYLAHPLLMATYILLLLLAVNPYLFGVSSVGERFPLIALVFGSSFLIPGLVVLMMVGLEMLPSIHMPEREQRTIPLIAVGMLYLGLFAFCRSDAEVPTAYTAMVLGCVSGLFTAFFVNLFTKISLHAVGMGGLLAVVLVIVDALAAQPLVLYFGATGVQVSLLGLLLFAMLLTGLVGTSRLWLRAHQLEDVLGGYIVGFATMMISYWVYA